MPARNLVDSAGAKAHDVLLVEDDPGSVLITREAFDVSQAPGTLHVVGTASWRWSSCIRLTSSPAHPGPA
jgi:hypothetical protein